jgi:DNA-binding NarL/FixJ family response regulator
MSPVRILIVEDHPVFRRGIIHVIKGQSDLQVVGEAENGLEAVQMVSRLQPDVILMDIHMPVMDGIQATQQITSMLPGTGIIMLTVERDDDHVFSAIKAGARGYLLKETEESSLIAAIYAVARGEGLIDPTIAGRVLDEFRRLSDLHPPANSFQNLTELERAILKRLAQGEENHTIAQHLHLSEKTVVNRLTTIYQKLHVNNRTQAALYALRQGIASISTDENLGDDYQ